MQTLRPPGGWRDTPWENPDQRFTGGSRGPGSRLCGHSHYRYPYGQGAPSPGTGARLAELGPSPEPESQAEVREGTFTQTASVHFWCSVPTSHWKGRTFPEGERSCY